jgi:hypothetical protein
MNILSTEKSVTWTPRPHYVRGVTDIAADPSSGLGDPVIKNTNYKEESKPLPGIFWLVVAVLVWRAL